MNIENKWNYYIGQQIGDMIIQDMYRDKYGNLVITVKCDKCGHQKNIRASNIKMYPNIIYHNDTCCNPIKERYPIGLIKDDMTIIGYDKDNNNGRILLKCECNICHNIKIIRPDSIKDHPGITSHNYCNRNYYNGLAQKHPELYSIWNAMIQRTTNPNCKDYSNYGGRGIDTEYNKDNKGFVGFIEDLSESYYTCINDPKYGKNNTTLDRIDNNKGYYKENLRWTTYTEQVMNRRCMIGKEFYAFAPNTNIYISNNQMAFARNHNLDSSHISECLNGKRNTVSGWYFYYKDPEFTLFQLVNVIEEMY